MTVKVAMVSRVDLTELELRNEFLNPAPAVPKSVELLIGESKINVLRAVAVVLLYGQHLFSYFIVRDVAITIEFHNQVNLVVLAWVVLIAFVFILVQTDRWPIWFSYSVILIDAILITSLLFQSQNPNSIQKSLFLILISLSTLRLLRSMVWYSVAVSAVGYLCFLVYCQLRVADTIDAAGGVPSTSGEPFIGSSAPLVTQHDAIFFLVLLLVAGTIAHQCICQSYRLASRSWFDPLANEQPAVEPADGSGAAGEQES